MLTAVIMQPSFSADENWTDTFYQYRIPVVLDVKEAGWQTIPISQTQITEAINNLEEMHFNPLFFAYINSRSSRWTMTVM
jgi:hypothetical protein